MVKFRVHIESDAKDEYPKSVHNAAMKAAMTEMPRYWHAYFRKRHFVPSAHSKYGYTKRSVAYNRRKWHQKKHQNPLVWSGDSKSRSVEHRLIATRNASRVTMPVQAFNFRPPNSKVDMRKEFTTVSQDEVAKLEERAARALERELNRNRGKIRKTG